MFGQDLRQPPASLAEAKTKLREYLEKGEIQKNEVTANHEFARSGFLSKFMLLLTLILWCTVIAYYVLSWITKHKLVK